jgi:hypothetical protein
MYVKKHDQVSGKSVLLNLEVHYNHFESYIANINKTFNPLKALSSDE